MWSSCVQAVQQELQDLQSSCTQREPGAYEDIQLQRVLGVGGFGIVFEGKWKGCRAAIKVRAWDKHFKCGEYCSRVQGLGLFQPAVAGVCKGVECGFHGPQTRLHPAGTTSQ